MKLTVVSPLLFGFLSITQARSITKEQHSVPALSNTAVSHKFSDWLSAFNTANETTIVDFYETHYNLSNVDVDVETNNTTHLAMLFSEPIQLVWMANWTGGFEFVDVEPGSEHSDTSITVLLKQKTHPGYFRAKMEIDDEQPGQPITKLDLEPCTTPLRVIPMDHPNRTLYEKGLQPLTPTLREKLIQNIVTVLREQYIYPQQAEEKIAILESNLKSGKYDTIINSNDLMPRLGADITNISTMGSRTYEQIFIAYHEPYNLHLNSDAEIQVETNWLEEYFGHTGYGFGNVSLNTEDLPGRIVASLPITHLFSIEEPTVLEAATRAMNSVSDADVLILDLRNNFGMSAATAAFVLSYLFDEQRALTTLLDRDGNVQNTTSTMSIEELRARGVVYERIFGGSKPVYVLTNNNTMNEAELIAYTVQKYGRGVVIGEQEATGGWASPQAVRFPLCEEEFGEGWWSMYLQTSRLVHVATGTNWEDVGVKSDVVVEETGEEEHCHHKGRLAAIEMEKKKGIVVQDELR